MTVELERRIELLEKRSKRAIWTSLLLAVLILSDCYLGVRDSERQYQDIRELRNRARDIEYRARRVERHVELPGLPPITAYGETL